MSFRQSFSLGVFSFSESTMVDAELDKPPTPPPLDADLCFLGEAAAAAMLVSSPKALRSVLDAAAAAASESVGVAFITVCIHQWRYTDVRY